MLPVFEDEDEEENEDEAPASVPGCVRQGNAMRAVLA
jgi:hypothetical protein